MTVVRNKKEMTLSVTPDTGRHVPRRVWDPNGNILLQLFQNAGQRASKIAWQ